MLIGLAKLTQQSENLLHLRASSANSSQSIRNRDFCGEGALEQAAFERATTAWTTRIDATEIAVQARTRLSEAFFLSLGAQLQADLLKEGRVVSLLQFDVS